MTLEEAVVARLQRVPAGKREQILRLLDEWIEQHGAGDVDEARRAIAVVQDTWATVTLDQQTLRWIAEDKELEYDLG